MIRQPLGVTAIIAPFNFPGMIPFWFLPYSIAWQYRRRQALGAGATDDAEGVRPARQPAPPPGVVNLVNGGREAVDAILDHPTIRSVSFVGSSAVARHVYSPGAAAGKRVQCQGGAKNPVIVMPDADMAGVRNHCGQRARLRRPAVPGIVIRGRRRRCGPLLHRGDRRARGEPRDRIRP